MNKTGRHRDLLIFAGYVAVVLVVAALLAPVFFLAGRAFLKFALDHGWQDSAALGWIVHAAEKTGLPGYFDRAAMVAALAGLWPLMQLLRIHRADLLGTEPLPRGLGHLALGLVLACGMLLVAAIFFVKAGAAEIRPHAPWLRIGGPLMTGLCVAFLEEFLFRGAMLGTLRRSLGTRGAVWWTTVIFATLHFLKPPPHGAIPDESVTWTSGLQIIPQLFNGFGEWQHVAAEFLLLLAVGWVLARARVLTDGLCTGIGLHAGWVAAMKYFSQVAKATGPMCAGDFSPWIAENHCKAIVGSFVGIVPVLAVLLTGLVIFMIVSPKQDIAPPA